MKKILIFLLLTALSINLMSQCSGQITITSFNPTPYPNQTFPPNTSVDVCITMNGWTEISSNWLDGFDLDLGEGWISVAPLSAPNDIDNTSGTWLWMDNVTSSFTDTTVGPGYFFEGPEGNIDGNPGNDWGDDCNPPNCTWSFCITLTTSSIIGQSLDISVTALGDGTIGNWGEIGQIDYDLCNNPIIDVWNGFVGECPVGCTDPGACNFNPLASCDDGTCNFLYPGEITHNLITCPDTVCTGLEVSYSVNGNPNSTYNWNITGGGIITPNLTNDCEIIWGNTPGTYGIWVQEITEQGCVGDTIKCDVEVVVSDITFDTSQYNMCLNGSVELNAEPLGGSWSSEYMNLNTFIGTRPGTYNPQYTTNIHGCDITESVKVKVKSKYEAPPITFASEYIDLCLETGDAYYLTPDSLNYTYSWFIENAKQNESSNQLFVQWPDTSRVYLIKVIGYDEIGCESEPSLMSIKVESCQRFFAPNSFTPNGDGTNDIFELRGMSVYQPTLKIFDRWGNVVYRSNNLWWTGDCGTGYYCNTDVYNWIIEYRDKDGFNKEEKGFVTLIR